MDGLYKVEEDALNEFVRKFNDDEITKSDMLSFVNNYRDLLDQNKVMTKVSDRLQLKINKANEKILLQNDEIKEKNTKLTEVIDQLMLAKIGKQAAGIILFFGLALFILEELFVEPVIDDYLPTIIPDNPLLTDNKILNLIPIGIVPKTIIAIILKTGEGRLERFLTKNQQKKVIESSGVIEDAKKIEEE
ncbi:MAG: hypothetical protein QM536_06250 [Chitinophagaceae bacterium]|nr:hypothetical protein [Chitinophagaceae bacterium]